MELKRTLTAVTFVFAAVAIAAETPRKPSAHGPNDRLGAINHLSPAGVLQAASLVETGKVYSLAVTTGPKTVAYGDRQYRIHVAPIYVGDARTYGSNRLQGFDDVVVSHLGVGTQLDGFAHIAVDSLHYNGAKTEDVIRPDGAIRYGIDELPPIVTRGVLLDMAAATGSSKAPGGTVFNRKEIERAAARQKVVLRKGDVVLLHAGHLAKADEEARHSLDSIAGLGVEGAEYLADLGVVAVGLDAWIPDATPPEKEGEFLPVHGKLLVERGVYILENVRTAELAADEAYEFLFVLGAPRFKGAVQSVVHPIAIR
jgi:kynurenine formamidase